MGGGGTKLLAAAPVAGEEDEPPAPPVRCLSLRTGISGGSPGASVAGAGVRPGDAARSAPLPHAAAAAATGSGPPGSASARVPEGRPLALIGCWHDARVLIGCAVTPALLGNVVFFKWRRRGLVAAGGKMAAPRERR